MYILNYWGGSFLPLYQSVQLTASKVLFSSVQALAGVSGKCQLYIMLSKNIYPSLVARECFNLRVVEIGRLQAFFILLQYCKGENQKQEREPQKNNVCTHELFSGKNT